MQNPIQWFPGHMAKTKRVIAECLPDVDVVFELLDARIPYSSKNPDVENLLGDKPRLVLMTKSELADPAISKEWADYYRKAGIRVILIDSLANVGIREIPAAVREILAEKLRRYEEKGMSGKKIRAMTVGIPNVGKSSLINRLAAGKRAKVEDRPGVTLQKQWIPTSIGFDLLDMPGVLAPKFEDATVGENLALTGAIRDGILDTAELSAILCGRLYSCAKEAFCARYKIKDGEGDGLSPYELFSLVAKKRGFLIAGGEIDEDRTAAMLLDEFRGGKIGRISLERPNEK